MKNSKKDHCKKDANTIMIVDRNTIRKLIIPREKVEEKSVVLPLNAYDKIKENSQGPVKNINSTNEGEGITQERSLERPEKVERQLQIAQGFQKLQQTETSYVSSHTKTEEPENSLQQELLKEELLNQEIRRLQESRVSDEVDEEERLEKERILARNEQLKREQEDIVKKCNSLILSTQCKVIQDAQIVEKELMKEEFQQNENLMDEMMEKERKQILQDMQKKREQDLARKQKYAASIVEQIQENEKQRLQEMKRQQREFKLKKLQAEQQTCDRSKNLQHEFALRAELKKQNEQINESIQQETKRKREQEKLENIKIQQLVERKLEEEKELELVLTKEKQRRERELARLWKIQKNSRSLQQLRDEIVSERIQEEMQRKWRERELETARKKKQEIVNLKSIRDQQICHKQRAHAIGASEKEKEAEKNASENEKLRNELLDLQLKQNEKMNQYRTTLQKQIHEKEQRKRRQRDEALKEHADLLIRLQRDDQMVKETIKHKINQIRSGNVPRSYVNHLEKHFNIAPPVIVNQTSSPSIEETDTNNPQ